MISLHDAEAPHSADVPTALLARVRSEYREMPGLRLSVWQASRLWAIDSALASVVLETLVAAQFLARSPQGTYLQRSTR